MDPSRGWYYTNGGWRDGVGDTLALHGAIHYHNTAFVLKLLQRGVNPNLVDANGRTPLFTAIARLIWGPAVAGDNQKRDEIVNLLLAYQADPNIACNRVYPIDMAVNCGEDDLVLRLLQYGSTTTTNDPYSPLTRAIKNHFYPMIMYLLHFGANPNEVTSIGNTPLHIAAAMSRGVVVWELLRHGARIDALGHAGETPLYRAMQNTWGDEVAEVLLLNGAFLEPRGAKSGYTPLERAVVRRNWPAVWTLLRFDPNPEIRFFFMEFPNPSWACPYGTLLLLRKNILVLDWFPMGYPWL